ncbi:Protein IQ-DOMAIN [Dirofilaria immitis]
MAESSSENYKVPTGLRPLLETLVRETLRIQPTDLISSSLLFFIVFQNHRKRRILFYMNLSKMIYESRLPFETIQLGLSRTETDIMWPSAKCITSLNAEKDLKSYSVNATGSVVEKDVTEDRAATIIQTEIRSFLTRRHLRQIKKEGNDAARKIQAHIRGYLTRKHLDEVGILHKYSTVSHLHNGLQEHM